MKDIATLTSQLRIRLSDMQKAVCQAMLQSTDDLTVLSATGTGKTLAYLLPLTQMVDAASEEVQVVVVTPGRELAQQSAQVLTDLRAGLRAYACTGGRAAMDEHREIRALRPQVLFGTPGRLIDHLEKDNVKMGSQLCALVIDEFDKCLAMGFRTELMRLLELLPTAQRRVLLSATQSDEVAHFVRAQHHRTLHFLPEGEAPLQGRVKTWLLRSPEADKLQTLSQLLRATGSESTIVFVNYRDAVERTAGWLAEEGFVAIAYHGGLEQRAREAALFRFAFGAANVLVCTDLGSRGLDLPDVHTVVHYHLPESPEVYVHRLGRTARWEAKGRAVFLLGPTETLPDYVKADEVDNLLLPNELPIPPRPKTDVLYIGRGKRDKLSKFDIVGFLCKVGELQGEDIRRIELHDHHAYVAVTRHRLPTLIKQLKGKKIKGMATVFEKMQMNVS